MQELKWIRFGKLLSLDITPKDKNFDDYSVKLNFEYSNSKIKYYSATDEYFLEAIYKAEALIGEDVDLFCYTELEYEPKLKLWSDIRKTDIELHKIDKISKVWGLSGKLTSVLINMKYIEIYIEHWGNYFIVKDHDNTKFLDVLEKVKIWIGQRVQLFQYERRATVTDQFDHRFFYDIRKQERTKQSTKNQDEGFFRDMDIPYEGLTDDEKDSW